MKKTAALIIMSVALVVAIGCPFWEERPPFWKECPPPPFPEYEPQETPIECTFVPLEEAGLSLDIPFEELGKDPFLVEISKNDEPPVGAFYFCDISEYAEKFTVLECVVAGDFDVLKFTAGVFSCCKISELENEENYFSIKGRAYTIGEAKQYLVAINDEWAVFDLTEFYMYGNFDEMADEFYAKHDFREPDNTWLKNFRRTLIENSERYIFGSEEISAE